MAVNQADAPFSTLFLFLLLALVQRRGGECIEEGFNLEKLTLQGRHQVSGVMN